MPRTATAIELASGWAMRNARKPARVREEDSETPYMTRRAIDFMREAGDAPWCLHLSYIKPHWPYIAPPPYNDMYGAGDVIPAVRAGDEKTNPHPVYREFMEHRVSQVFSRDEVRAEVIPVYMGLIKQIDDQMGVLFRFMEEHGLFENTMIVFTSDHGDYFGDHWLGEKDFFHDASVKVPLIIYDPIPRRTRRAAMSAMSWWRRSTSHRRFSMRLARTLAQQSHRLEGRSLLPCCTAARRRRGDRLRSANTIIRCSRLRRNLASSRAMRGCS